MRATVSSVGLALSAVVANAQAPSFTLSLTSENGGADTRFSWSYTGTPAFAAQSVGEALMVSGVGFYSAPIPSQITPTGSSGSAFSGNLTTITGLTTGLYFTNTTTGQTSTFNQIQFIGIFGLVLWNLQDPVDGSFGQQIVLSGPTSGSFLSGLAFSNFNAGSWTAQQSRSNFDSVLTVGAPVPEPSTYGFALGGLALVGAAIRRRRK